MEAQSPNLQNPSAIWRILDLMAITSSHKLFHTVNTLLIAKGRRENANSDAIIPPMKGNMGMLESGSIQQQTFREASFFLGKHKDISHHIASSNPQSGNLCMIVKASGTTEKHLKSLNSYLGKLHNKAKYLSWKIENQKTEAVDRSDKLLFRNGIKSLENYLTKVKNDDEPENIMENLEASLSTDAENAEGIGRDLSLKSFMESKIDDAEGGRYSADHASDFYLIGVLASINIAVLLFEIATPVKNSEFALFSIPSVYGAKVNNLILTGEWWRLVTPMFLHSGIFHISLSSWVLFTFGLEVSQEYGSFTCLLIYLLGGISGNLISFLHTSSPTVGGTLDLMAITSSHKLFHTVNTLLIAKGRRENVNSDAIIPPIKGNMGMLESGSIQQQTFREASFFLGKHKDISRHIASSNPQSGNLCMIVKASGTTEKHLKSLNSYLGKIHNKAKYLSWKIENQKTEAVDRSDKLLFRNGIKSLENYLTKVTNDDEPENIMENLETSLSTDAENAEGIGRDFSLKSFMESKIDDAEGGRYSADHASDFYLIGVLASINIAVLLFEIATPVKNSEFALFSIPSVYGAKVNNLILTGEWWRLVTPMFLHSGIFHISLSSWVLFTFGLEVSQEYGSFTCLLIYLLGGISGNLISFLHTSSPTVGGTGPVFALIGAWLIYQVQNKDFIARESSERMFRKAIIFTALSFVVSSFGPIDDWAHFAAAFTGVAYGYVTCPSLQVKDASSETCQEDGMTLIRRYAGPCKSLVYFSIFMLLLSSLLFIVEPPLDLI